MRPFVYIILFALTLIVFKAFFVDEYLAKKKLSESNATEVNTSSVSFTKPVPQLKTRGVYGGEQNLTIKKMKPAYSDMPLEKVGNEIADKLEDKL